MVEILGFSFGNFTIPDETGELSFLSQNLFSPQPIIYMFFVNFLPKIKN
jgi:hypothetical protein